MHRRLKLGFFVVALALFASCDRESSPVAVSTIPSKPPNPRLARAVVTSDQATITIPVGKRSVWQWNRLETPNSQREYQWEVVPPDMGAFGFSLFKAPGSQPKEGSLSELLNQGQTSMWEALPDNGGQMVPGVAISTRTAKSDSAVDIVVNDRRTVGLLLSRRPATVQVFTRAPLAQEQRYTVPVEYIDR